MVIAITGIHGNFYSNPFYVNFGETLNAAGIDTDAFDGALADGRAQAALDEDMAFAQSLGIRSLPAFLVRRGDQALMLHGLPVNGELEVAVKRLGVVAR